MGASGRGLPREIGGLLRMIYLWYEAAFVCAGYDRMVAVDVCSSRLFSFQFAQVFKVMVTVHGLDGYVLGLC
jgi:hypothetical protein